MSKSIFLMMHLNTMGFRIFTWRHLWETVRNIIDMSPMSGEPYGVLRSQFDDKVDILYIPLVRLGKAIWSVTSKSFSRILNWSKIIIALSEQPFICPTNYCTPLSLTDANLCFCYIVHVLTFKTRQQTVAIRMKRVCSRGVGSVSNIF